MSDLISRELAIELLENTIAMTKKEERRRNYCVELIKAMPSEQPEYEELTSVEAAAEIASGSIMSACYWLDVMILVKQMGYVICRKR